MILANTPGKWLAVVTLGLCLTPAVVAQNESSSQPAKSQPSPSNQASKAATAKPVSTNTKASKDGKTAKTAEIATDRSKTSTEPAKSKTTAADHTAKTPVKPSPTEAKGSKEVKSATAANAVSSVKGPTTAVKGKGGSAEPAAKASGAKPASTKANVANTAKPEKAPKTAKNAAEASVIERPFSVATRRDPFLPLISERKELAGPGRLPPGKGGLVISTVRVDGTVRSEEGMIAVLSNADQRTYFVREGDRLYDGAVEKINLEGVTFRQDSKDAFGKPVERVVTKRIYATAGEQQ